jgi:iron complex outermembrane receptor protein
MKYTLYLQPIALVLGVVSVLFVMSTAVAQETTEEAAAESEEGGTKGAIELEGVTIIGSRVQPRSVTDSAVPIDILGGDEFVKQGYTDLQDLLRNVVPSYNVNTQPIGDAATVVRPANLRGFASDHTLVLVNGKRRHRASVIYWLGNGVADGAQGADLSPIPAIALKRVEVLRDGASAQYGSDAIAGVMNFQLKDNYQGVSIETRAGTFKEGDGQLFTVAGNIGLGRENLWTNLSMEYGSSDATIRSVQRYDAANLINAGNTNVLNPAQIWGQPEVEDDIKLFANYGATLHEGIKFYGHANYASKRVEGGFYFRNPNTRGGVFTADGGKTLLIGNLAGGDVPVVKITNHVPDPVALQQVFDDDNLFTFQELFPGGFTPRFGADTEDESVLVGLKGTPNMMPKFTWDLSASYGQHESDFFIFNTVNASMGKDTPTEFDPGAYIQTDINLNFDATYPLHDMVSLAAGLEYRTEEFEIVQGQKESFEIGPLAAQGFSSSSNGFPGFGDIAAGSWNRSNVAAYLETELRPVKKWLVGVALRAGNFEDFGSTINYKLATNYGITDALKVRSSYSTGFKAPTPGQQNAFNITTEFNALKNDLINNGTIPSTNPAAERVGGKALEPEKSKNLSIGFVVDAVVVGLTVDYFNIRMEDRLALSQDFQLTEAQVQELLAAGLTSAANLQEFRFFINDFETETQGLDVVLTTPVGKSDLSFAYNYTDTEVTKRNPKTLDDLRVSLLREGVPKNRWNMTLGHPLNDNLRLLGRVSYYGPWFEGTITEHTYSNEILVDLEATYTLAERTSLTIGAQNILDNYPDENPMGGLVGNIYGEYSPFGFGGAFWYAKCNYNF